jgi:2',3'-cyclic-nucleotide 2'-phosphodiesterase (5'-nucleotidase family)
MERKLTIFFTSDTHGYFAPVDYAKDCRADTGLGMLSDTFRRINETFREPMEYSPPCKCIQGII